MREKSCVFCGCKAGSREHVIPSWVTNGDRYRIMVKPAFYTSSLRNRFVVHDFGNIEDERGQMSNGNITCKYVCGECNEGWMSRVENEMKEIVTLTKWGSHPVNLVAHVRKIHRWLMLRFTAVNAFWGNKAKYNSSFCAKIKNDDLPIHYVDAFFGYHDAVELAVASPVPEPDMLEEDRLALCGHSLVVTAQVGRLYIRAFHTGVLSGIGIVRASPKITVLASRFPHRCSYVDPQNEHSDGMEFIHYSSGLLACQLITGTIGTWSAPV